MAFVQVEQTVVCNTIRALLKAQVKTSWMRQDVIKFIVQNKLVEETEWPSHLLSLTEAGREYLQENSQE